MKAQYFGDLNDYAKYAFLHQLVTDQPLSLTVCWMLTPPDGRSDGGFIDYLRTPDRYRPLAPSLFDLLASAVAKNERNLDVLHRSDALPNTRFFSTLLLDGAAQRRRFFTDLWSFAASTSIVFFDPDNGFGVRSVPKGRRGSSKYLYFDELIETFARGHSVICYQHFPRVSREPYSRELLHAVGSALGVPTFAVATSRVLFVCAAQATHSGLAESAAAVAGKSSGLLSFITWP